MLQFPYWSNWMKVASILLTLSNILTIVAYSTNAWIQYEAEAHAQFDNWGVYRLCTGHRNVQEDCPFIMGPDYPAWYKAVQGMGSIGLILLFASLIILAMYMCLPDLNENKNMRLLLVISCFSSSFFLFSAVIIYGSKWLQLFDTSLERAGSYLSYSYGLACVGVVLDIFGGICCLVDYAKHIDDDKPEPKNFFM